MYLKHISLTNFRNFTRLDMDIPMGNLVLVGSNAQGKTSLLEAIYLLATLSSFHAENDRQMINFIAAREKLAVARIVADYENRGRSHRLEVRIIQEMSGFNGGTRSRKEVLLDGLKLKLSEAVGKFNAVLFLPQMLRVIDGSPRDRRRYIDLGLAQVVPNYTAVLSQYNKVLPQRNALLKQVAINKADPAQLSYWDNELITFGSQLIHARINGIQEIENFARLIHHDLTRTEEVLRINYFPAFDPLPQPENQLSLGLDEPISRSHFSLAQIEEKFRGALEANRRAEINRGVSLLGPHRDEIRFLSNGVDLGRYGSRGQVRTTMLTLKLAEVAWMHEKTGQWPVLLLDEVLAELDNKRRSDLLARVLQSEQSMLTTTDLNLFTDGFLGTSNVWKIQGGRVESEKREAGSGK